MSAGAPPPPGRSRPRPARAGVGVTCPDPRNSPRRGATGFRSPVWHHRGYGCRRHRGRRRARRPGCHARAGRGGPFGAAARPRTARVARRPGVLVPGRPVLRQLPGAAAAADPRLGRAGPGRLAGQRRVRPAGGLLAAPLGRGVRALRGRRAAVLAARARGALVPAGAVGRARRLHRPRTRQLGPPLPPHLGHRTRHWSSRSPTRCCSRGRCGSGRGTGSPRSRSGPTACTCPATCWRAASCPAAYAPRTT